MSRRDVLDEIWIRGQLYSIKKIQKWAQKDNGLEPKTSTVVPGPGFECPECKRFNEIIGDKPKFCKYCGQRLKWPRKKRKES